jgi:hypothetical protein
MEKLIKYKHSSLLQKSVIYGQKSFITFGPKRKLGRIKVETSLRGCSPYAKDGLKPLNILQARSLPVNQH